VDFLLLLELLQTVLIPFFQALLRQVAVAVELGLTQAQVVGQAAVGLLVVAQAARHLR